MWNRHKRGESVDHNQVEGRELTAMGTFAVRRSIREKDPISFDNRWGQG